jgi:thiol:disulfide interchange protein DsbD
MRPSASTGPASVHKSSSFGYWFRLAVVGYWPLLVLLALLPWTARADEKFLEPQQAFALTVEQSDSAAGSVKLHWAIAAGYYLYRDRIRLDTASAGGGSLDKPAGDHKKDPTFGDTEVYHDAVTVLATAPGAHAITVTWQGCADAGLCYPPQTREIVLASGAAEAGPAKGPSALPGLLEGVPSSDSQITSLLDGHSLAWTLPLFFLFGIALAFTPCVLPMVPILSGIVVGSQAPPRRAFGLSLAFVIWMALTYALLGGIAAAAGANLQAFLQNRFALTAFAAVFVVLAMPMFGLFELQLPAFVRDRLDTASRGRKGGTLAGAAGMGVLSALLVGPCMTAPLAGTLLYIAQTGNLVSGALLLLALGLGMGTPLVAVGTLGARYLPKPGPWMERVKGGFGFLLLATAIWMVERVLPATLTLALWGALLASLALTLVHLSAGRALESGAGGRLILRTAALVCGLWDGAMVVGATAGGTDPLRPLGLALVSQQASGGDAQRVAGASAQFETVSSPQLLRTRLDAARAAGKPAVVDFYADWCVSCQAIDREVFTDPRVRQALANAVLLRADVTSGNAEQLALMSELQILGPPTVLLFDAQGREKRNLRLVGEFDVAEFLRRTSTEADSEGGRS